MTALIRRLRTLHRTHRKAFTALEVLLVVTLVFVVAVIGFPSVQEAKPRSSVRAVAMQLAEDLRLARQTAIAKNMPVGVLFSNENGTKAVTRGYYFMEGHTDPKVTKVVDYSRTNAEACIFIGYWRLGDPAKTTSVTEPAISAHAKNFSMTSWNGASRDYAFVFLPSGVTKTNDLPHFDGAYHVVVAKAVDAATRSSAELPGDFLLTALTAMASPSPYYELSGVWTPAYTVSITPLGNITVSEGVTGIDPALLMNTPAPAIDPAVLPSVWAGANTAPSVAAGDFEIFPVPNAATLPAGIDALVRRDGHINFSVKASDAQGDVTYCTWSDARTSGTGPPNGTFSVAGEVEMDWSQAQSKYLSSVQWTPPPNAVGRDEYRITLTVRDGSGDATTSTKVLRIEDGHIMFQSTRDGNPEIYAMSPDGTGLMRLTAHAAWDGYASYSPDGTKIAFSSEKDGNCEIYLMNADGTGRTRLTSSPSYDYQPNFSPDGARIAFVSHRDGNYEVYVMNADGTGQTRLTSNAALEDRFPCFSPDGARIAFMSDRGGSYQIFIMNADGTGQTRLTSTVYDCYPCFSPDGTRISFTSKRDGNYQIYVMNTDGTGQTRLTNNSSADSAPCFSPDGNRIAFTSNRDGNEEIYVMNADGTGQTRLTNDANVDQLPSWGR